MFGPGRVALSFSLCPSLWWTLPALEDRDTFEDFNQVLMNWCFNSKKEWGEVLVWEKTFVWARSPGFHPNCPPAPPHPPTLKTTAPDSHQVTDSSSPQSSRCCCCCLPLSAVCWHWSTLHPWCPLIKTPRLCNFPHWNPRPFPPPTLHRSRGGSEWCCPGGLAWVEQSPHCGPTPRWWSGFSLGFPWCHETPSSDAAVRWHDRKGMAEGRHLCSYLGDWNAESEWKEKNNHLINI